MSTETANVRPSTIRVWRSGDPLPTPEPTPVVKKRVPLGSAPPIIVVKADPAVAAEAERKAQAKRDAKAAQDLKAAREVAEAKAKSEANKKAELARLEQVRVEREKEEAEERIRAAAAAHAAKAAAEKAAWLALNAPQTTKPKAVVKPAASPLMPSRKERRGGVSLEMLREVCCGPVRTATMKPIIEPKQQPASLKSTPVQSPAVNKSFIRPPPPAVTTPKPKEYELLAQRIKTLDARIVINVYRGAVIKFRWETTEEMLVAATTNDSDAFTGLRLFVDRCEKAATKTAQKAKK